jgi:hypothetical protein
MPPVPHFAACSQAVPPPPFPPALPLQPLQAGWQAAESARREREARDTAAAEAEAAEAARSAEQVRPTCDAVMEEGGGRKSVLSFLCVRAHAAAHRVSLAHAPRGLPHRPPPLLPPTCHAQARVARAEELRARLAEQDATLAALAAAEAQAAAAGAAADASGGGSGTVGGPPVAGDDDGEWEEVDVAAADGLEGCTVKQRRRKAPRVTSAVVYEKLLVFIHPLAKTAHAFKPRGPVLKSPVGVSSGLATPGGSMSARRPSLTSAAGSDVAWAGAQSARAGWPGVASPDGPLLASPSGLLSPSFRSPGGGGSGASVLTSPPRHGSVASAGGPADGSSLGIGLATAPDGRIVVSFTTPTYRQRTSAALAAAAFTASPSKAVNRGKGVPFDRTTPASSRVPSRGTSSTRSGWLPASASTISMGGATLYPSASAVQGDALPHPVQASAVAADATSPRVGPDTHRPLLHIDRSAAPPIVATPLTPASATTAATASTAETSASSLPPPPPPPPDIRSSPLRSAGGAVVNLSMLPDAGGVADSPPAKRAPLLQASPIPPAPIPSPPPLPLHRLSAAGGEASTIASARSAGGRSLAPPSGPAVRSPSVSGGSVSARLFAPPPLPPPPPSLRDLERAVRRTARGTTPAPAGGDGASIAASASDVLALADASGWDALPGSSPAGSGAAPPPPPHPSPPPPPPALAGDAAGAVTPAYLLSGGGTGSAALGPSVVLSASTARLAPLRGHSTSAPGAALRSASAFASSALSPPPARPSSGAAVVRSRNAAGTAELVIERTRDEGAGGGANTAADAPAPPSTRADAQSIWDALPTAPPGQAGSPRAAYTSPRAPLVSPRTASGRPAPWLVSPRSGSAGGRAHPIPILSPRPQPAPLPAGEPGATLAESLTAAIDTAVTAALGLPVPVDHLPVVDALGNLMVDGGADAAAAAASPRAVRSPRGRAGAPAASAGNAQAAAEAAPTELSATAMPSPFSLMGRRMVERVRRSSVTSVSSGASLAPRPAAGTPQAAAGSQGTPGATRTLRPTSSASRLTAGRPVTTVDPLAAVAALTAAPLIGLGGADPRCVMLEPGDVVLAVDHVPADGGLGAVARKIAARAQQTGVWVTVARPIGRMVKPVAPAAPPVTADGGPSGDGGGGVNVGVEGEGAAAATEGGGGWV